MHNYTVLDYLWPIMIILNIRELLWDLDLVTFELYYSENRCVAEF